VIYLDLAALLYVATRTLGAEPEVRDHGLLESALARLQATAFGQDAYPTIHEKAAALLHSLARNHALVDGNKRLGWLATYTFYAINGIDLDAPTDAAYELVIAVTQELADVAKIAQQLRSWRGTG
jgi:death-on-curing protein